MADTKTYNVIYNITANAGEAVTAMSSLAQSAEKLGNGRHMEKFNSQLKQLKNYTSKINESMNAFSPRVDLATFRSQLQLMEKAVAYSAQYMRNAIQTALSGTTAQFDRAMKSKGSFVNAMKEGLLAGEKAVKKDIDRTKKEIDRVSSAINANKISKDFSKDTDARLRAKENVLKTRLDSLRKTLAHYETVTKTIGNKKSEALDPFTGLIGNGAKNAQNLNEMTKAMAKWNKVVKGMPKTQEYKINLNAVDNVTPALLKIEERIAALKASAASIVIGSGAGITTKGKTSGSKVKPVPYPSSEGVMTRGEMKPLNSTLTQLKTLNAARAKGKLTDAQKALQKTLLPQARQMAGLGAGRYTPAQIEKALEDRIAAEKEKYNNYKAANKAASQANKAQRQAAAAARSAAKVSAPAYQVSSAQLPQSLLYRGVFNGGDVGFGASMTGHRVQGLVNQRPTVFRGVFNGGDVAFGANQTLYRTQELVDGRRIGFRGQFNPAGIRFGAGRVLVGLNQAAEQHRVQVRGIFDQSGLRFGLGRALVELQNIANSRPIRINAVVSQNGTIPSGGAARTTSMPKPGVYPSGGGGGASTPPPSMPGVVPSGTRRNPVNVRSIYDGGVFNATKRWLYPLTGNTSFGARTPAVVEMAKGMGMMMAVGGAMGAVGNSFSQSTDYQNMMTTTRAILGRSYKGNNFEGDIANMEKIVRREGVLTKFTAPEVAGAAKYLAMAGMDINTINSAIKPVVNIALAGDVDLPTAADKMTNIMTAFGMKTPSDFTRASDVLTNTFTKSNTNMLQLAEAAQYAAPIAAMRGMKLEDMMALVGVMSDAGIQSSMAGTTLRMMMNNIYKPSKNQQVMWDKLSKLGVTRTDRNGNWLNVIDILDQISQKVPVNGKAGETLADVMSSLFRVTSAAGATQLAKNITKVKSLRDSNIDSYGAAESIREARINNVRGKWAQVSSQFTENILKIFEKPEMQQKIMDMLDKFRGVLAKPETMKSLESVFDVMLSMAEFAGKMAEIGAKLVGVAPNLVKTMLMFQFVMTTIGSYVITPIVGLLNSIGVFMPGLGRGIANKMQFGQVAMRGGTTALRGGVAVSGAAGRAAAMAAIAANGTNLAAMSATQRAKMNMSMSEYYSGRQVTYTNMANRLRRNQIHAHLTPGTFWSTAATNPGIASGLGTAATAKNNMAVYGSTAAFWTAAMLHPERVARQGEVAERAARFSAMAAKADVKAVEAAKMAKNYANAAKYGYGYESAFAASMAMNTMAGRQAQARSGLERFVAQHERRRMHLGNKDIMTRAARIYNPATNYYNYRNAGAGRVNAFWRTTGRSLGFAGSGLVGALNAGMAAGTFKNVFGGGMQSTRSGLMGAIMGLSKAIGMLVSPVGLATIAIGGLTVGFGHFLSQTEKSKERIKQIKEDAQERSNEIKKHQNKLREFGRDHINSGAKNINWWSEASSGNPQLQHESEFKNIFRRDSKTASTSKDYWETMFEMYIRPYSKYIYGQDVTWSGFKNMFPMEGMGATSPDVIRRQVEQGAVYKIISNSGQYKYASEKAMRILSDWSKLPSDQRDAKYDDVMNQLRSIRDSFDYKNGLDISGKDFKTLRYGDIGRSKQGKYAAWQLLNNLINGDDYNAKQLFAKYNISHAAPFSNNWFDSFDTILNSIVLDDFKGAILQFKNGSANWKKFADDTKKLGVDFTNTTNGHLEILTAIAKHIINDPNLKELESVRKYLEGLIRYINDFNAKEMLNRHRNMMYEWVAPTNTPITITTGEGDAPEGIRKPGNKTWNWNYVKESINTRNNGVNAAKYGVIDQTPFKPSKYEGPLSSNTVSPTNNTVNIHIDSVVGADRDSAQLFSDIVGKELVNALGIINEQYQGNVS